MGQVKHAMEENEANGNLVEFLEELLRQDAFIGALQGIAKQAVGKGLKSLSPTQRDVVDKFVTGYKNAHECPRCSNGNVSSLTDLIFIAEKDLCPMCESDREKFMRD
jgi:hypothetical protein